MKKLLLLASCWILAWPCMANIEINEEASLDCICSGTASQAIILKAYGTAGPFYFLWNGPNGYTSTEQSPYDISAPGLYTVTVTNAYGCETILEAELLLCPGLNPIQFEITPNCGSGGGDVTATVEGGEGDLDYEWSNGVEGEVLNNVPAGTYTLTVTNTVSGCTIEETAIVTDQSDEVSINTLVSCICEGQAPIQAFEVIAEGTAGPFTFQWEGPNGYTSTVQNPDDITEAGLYQLEVTNAYGCTASLTKTLYACPGFESLNLEVTPDCGGVGGDILSTVVENGNPAPFLFYDWSNGNPTPSLYNVPAGTYTLTVTNTFTGCTIVETAVVEDQPNADAFEIVTQVWPACTPHTGRIEIDVNGAQDPVNIQWSTGVENDYEQLHINSGTYRVTVTDDNGCTVIEQIQVPPGPVVSAELIPATCMDADPPDGSIQLNISTSGSLFNTVEWDDDPSGIYLNQTLRENLPPGSYGVTITSPDGCVFQDTYDVTPTEPVDYYPYLKRVRIWAYGAGFYENIYDGQWMPNLENRLIFGMYPDVVNNEKGQEREILKNLVNSYLYRDILSHGEIRKPEVLLISGEQCSNRKLTM